jgi:hypothetical protein
VLIEINEIIVLAPRVGHPVQAVKLIVSELQSIPSYIGWLLLHSAKPRPLFEHLERERCYPKGFLNKYRQLSIFEIRNFKYNSGKYRQSPLINH